MTSNKTADKITSVSKKPAELYSTELPNNNINNNNHNHNNNNSNDNDNQDVEITAHKKRCISPKERQQIIDELRLVPKKDACF